MKPINLAPAMAIDGWMAREELRWLAERAQDANVIIEIGSLRGRSTRVLVDHIRPGGTVYAVDPWSGPYLFENGTPCPIDVNVYREFCANFTDEIASGRVIPIRRRSTSVGLEMFPPADLVFIDGDHRYETVKSDIERFWTLVQPGGILSGHDLDHVDWPGVRRAVDEAFPRGVNHVKSIWWTTV